jgi:hypothetical protein
VNKNEYANPELEKGKDAFPFSTDSATDSVFDQKNVKKIAAANAAKLQRSAAEVQTRNASQRHIAQKARICIMKINLKKKTSSYLSDET